MKRTLTQVHQRPLEKLSFYNSTKTIKATRYMSPFFIIHQHYRINTSKHVYDRVNVALIHTSEV